MPSPRGRSLLAVNQCCGDQGYDITSSGDTQNFCDLGCVQELGEIAGASKGRTLSTISSVSAVKDRSLSALSNSTSTDEASSISQDEIEVVDLGQGVVWVCCPFSRSSREVVGATASREAVHKLKNKPGLKANPDDMLEALLQFTHAEGTGRSANNSVQALCPEAMLDLDFCRWDGDGHYNIDHYKGEHPPNLGQIVAFLRMVDTASETAGLVLAVSSAKRRAVGAVLAGAVLVLARGMDASQAWDCITPACPVPSPVPQEAWDRFPGPFSLTGETTASSLTVLDCLEGLQAARDRRWLQDYHIFDIKGWRLLRQKFDASWLIPGEVLALANPAGTAANPRFPGLLEPSSPASPNPSLRTSTSQASLSSAMSQRPGSDVASSPRSLTSPGTPNSSVACFEAWDQDNLFGDVPGEHNALPVEMQMTIDVGSGPGDWQPAAPSRLPSPCGSPEELSALGNDTFATLFRRHNVKYVVRLNHDFECPQQSIHEETFKQSGFQVKKDSFNDGDTPTKAIAIAFSSTCRETCARHGKAVAVHCMGGLGRTGVLVGTYAVSHHRVSGKAFHGWSRICRPGTIQTQKQETFLRSLDSRRQVSSSSFGNLMELMRSRVPTF
eukprot:TRINITY_DN16282_c0_g1_i2.p1 TRINITY_DN16282_c0_g1~~TRINITY_DN16282_c0_g1_i2.p1  ORF type:complete len:612 (-),score=92.72 TRINITY_DN16282_c0_g1_i2:306-2141(-)